MHPPNDTAFQCFSVVVCGHTQCGGVKGAYSFAQEPSAAAAIANTPLGRWLTPLIKIADSKQIPEMGEEIGIPQLVRSFIHFVLPPQWKYVPILIRVS
jgi:hypothetical protein